MRLETPVVYRLVRCAAENIHILDEAACRFRQLLPGPHRVFDPCADLLARTRIGLLRTLNDLRAGAAMLRAGYPEVARTYLATAAVKLEETRDRLERARDLAASHQMILEPAVLLEHIAVTLRSLSEVELAVAS
jgi:hypothetical protein